MLKHLPLAALIIALGATTATGQTNYSSTLPTIQGNSLTSWTAFTFSGTPNTTGGATLTFSWLACYQGGFGTTGIEVELRTGASTYVPVYEETGGTISCSNQPRTATITAAQLQQALLYGGTTVQGRVRIDDACQPGVGCSFANDPVLSFLTLSYTVSAANFTSPDPGKCPGEVVQFTDLSINAPTSHSWSFPGGTPATSTLPNPAVQYSTAGQYSVTLTVVTSDGESTVVRPDFVTIHPLPLVSAGADQFLCEGASVNLQASGGSTYQWTPTTGLNDPTAATTAATPAQTTTYTVLGTSAQGCQNSDQVTVSVVPAPAPLVDSGSGILCAGDTLTLNATGATFYSWAPNLFISGTSGSAVEVWPTADQSWTVTGTDAFGCVGQSVVSITVVPAPATPTITWGDMVLSTGEAATYQWFLDGVALPDATAQTLEPIGNGTYTVVVTDANGCTATSAAYFFGTTGLTDRGAAHLTVVPQPANDVLQVRGAPEGARYRLLDAQGRTVAEGTVEPRTPDIAVRHLAVGMHTLLLTTAEGTVRTPVLIAR